MNYDYLIFDLDGTISDPQEGIVRSLNYSLSEHGFETQSREKISPHIGPPLDAALRYFTGSDDEQLISSMVASFRERYGDIGYSENSLYPGIQESLTVLTENSACKLGICTSKRTDFAEKILEMFSIRKLFTFVDGGDVGIAKWQQLEKLKKENSITENSLMIGDRHIDLSAARKNNLDGAGVLWGYGPKEELENEQPMYLFEKTSQLQELCT